jgi:hypothetical protein
MSVCERSDSDTFDSDLSGIRNTDMTIAKGADPILQGLF